MSDDAVREKVRLYVADVTPARLPSFGGVAVRRRRRRMRQALGVAGTVAVVVLAVVVGALATRGTSGTSAATGGDLASQLVGRTWDLTALTVDGKTTPVPTDIAWSLTLGRDTFSGNDGCNGQFGSVSYQQTTIRVGQAGSTLVGCAPDERPWEQAFQVLEAGRASATVAGDTLTLSVGGEVLTLAAKSPTSSAPVASPTSGPTSSPASSPAISPAPGPPSRLATTAGPPADLGTGKWLLESWTLNGVTTQAVAGSRRPWVQFSADRVIASDGCNSYSGSVTYQGATVGPLVGGRASLAACGGAAQAVGNAYDALLAHPIQVYVYDNGQRLTLSGDNLALSLHRDTGVQLPAAALALVGPTWRLQAVKAAGVDWHALAASKAALVLTSWGYQATSDGCSSQGGDLAFDSTGGVLTFGGGENAVGICDYAAPGPSPGVLPPANYFAALDGKVTATLTGETLTLTNGKTVLTFAR